MKKLGDSAMRLITHIKFFPEERMKFIEVWGDFSGGPNFI